MAPSILTRGLDERHPLHLRWPRPTLMLLSLVALTGCGDTVDANATRADSGGDLAAQDDATPALDSGATLGDLGQDTTEAPTTFRVVFIADTHIIGPQYTCCHESQGVDNLSIMKTPERLARTRDAINAMSPAPDMVIVLGDLMHDAHHAQEVDWYLENESAFSVARELFAGFTMPVHFVFGNHDYEINCNPNSVSYPHALSHQLFEDFFGAQPYAALEHKGWRFLLTNGQLGPSWEIGHEDCDTFYASYGREQLAWIAQQLDAGQPTVVLSHYMRPVTEVNEDPDGPHRDLFALLDARDNVRAVLVGHTHRWMDLTELNQGVPHHVLGATRYDSDNFWTVDFEIDGQHFEIVDFDKRIEVSTCAETWRYDGVPMSLPEAEEDGDCTEGLK